MGTVAGAVSTATQEQAYFAAFSLNRSTGTVSLFIMKCSIKLVFPVLLALSLGDDSRKEVEVRGNQRTCKNPKAKVGVSIFRNCAQATCMKTLKGAKWEECPISATETSILTQLAALKAGQSALDAGQKALDAGQNTQLAFFKAGQSALDEGQKALEAGQKALEAGQKVFEDGQKDLAELFTNKTTNTTTTTTTTTTGTTAMVVRLPTITSSWYVGKGRVDAIDLVPSRNIVIRGISLLRSAAGSGTKRLTGLIELKEDASKTVVTSQNFGYTENDDPAYYDQLFSNPGNVQAGVR